MHLKCVYSVFIAYKNGKYNYVEQSIYMINKYDVAQPQLNCPCTAGYVPHSLKGKTTTQSKLYLWIKQLKSVITKLWILQYFIYERTANFILLHLFIYLPVSYLVIYILQKW